MADGAEAAALYVTVRAITAQFTEAMAEVNRTIAGAGAAMTKAGEGMRKAGKTMTRDVTLPILGIGAASGKLAVDFQNSMELIHTQAGVPQAAIEKLSKSVLALAGPTATAPEKLSAGLYHLESQGLRGAKAMDALKTSAEGAKMGQADLEDVTNALGAVISANVGGFKSYGEAMGELNATVGAGDMRMQDLADAMGTGLPAKAKVYGASLKDVSGALATFGDNNIRGAEAGTLLNSTLRIMGAPTKAAAKSLATVGIGATQLADDIRNKGLVAAFQDLKTHLTDAGLTASQQAKVITRAFGGRQAGGVMILLDQLNRLKTKVKEVGDGGKRFASDWTAYTKTTAYHLASMGAQMQATGVTIGTILLPIVAKLADFIGRLAAAFGSLSPGMQKTIMVVAGLFAAIGPVLSIVGSLTTVIGGAVSAFATIGSAIFGTGTAMSLLATGPIVLIIGALIGLGVGLVEAYKHVQWFRDNVNAAFRLVQAGISKAMTFIRGVIRDVLAWAAGFWQRNGAEITAAAKRIEAGVRAAFKLIEAVARAVWPVVAAYVKAAWATIRAVVSAGAKVIEDVIRVACDLILGKWGKAWADVKKLVSDAVHGIVNVVKTVLSGLVHVAIAEATAIGHGIVTGILGGIEGLPGELAGKLHGMISGAIHSAGALLHGSGEYQFTRHTVGKPLADGIIYGYLTGIAPLTSKVSTSIRHAMEQSRAAVSQQQSAIRQAFTSLGQDADKAFDDATKQMASKLSDRMNAQLSAIDTRLKSTLASIQSQGAAQTPSEKAAAQLQDQMKGEQYSHDLSQAQGQLAQAQAGGDPQQIADAQYALNQLLEQHQLDALNQQAQVERAARDKQTQQREAAAKARAAREKAAVKKHYEQRKQALDAERALEKKSMDQRMKALEGELLKDPAAWTREHKAILKLFKKDIGPSMLNSGTTLGREFAKGIRNAFGDITKAAHDAAAILERYLRLHSPAKEGPLSSLDSWWSAFTPTLLSGLDTRAITRAATIAASPSLALSGTLAGAVVGAADGSGVIHLHVESPTYLDGREIARNSRDHLVKMGRYNGGGMLRGQA